MNYVGDFNNALITEETRPAPETGLSIKKKKIPFPFPLTNQFTTKKKDPSAAWIKLDIICITEPQYRK